MVASTVPNYYGVQYSDNCEVLGDYRFVTIFCIYIYPWGPQSAL